MKTRGSAKCSQRGAVVALFAIALVAIIAIAGLALDVSHAYVDKTRVQNALDAGALSGAMTLITSGGNTGNATTDAVLSFQEALKGTELDGSTPADRLTPDVEFLATLEDKTPNTTAGPFVRVKLREGGSGSGPFSMTTWFLDIIGRGSIDISGSAVAGPAAADSCNLAPFIVCGDMNKPCDTNSDNCYGFDVWNTNDPLDQEECYLKGCAQGGGDCDTSQVTGNRCGAQEGSATGGGTVSDVGTGSFYLAAIDGCKGGDCLKDAFKDGYNKCFSPDDPIETEPGVKKGPLEKAYNTKFNQYGGGINKADYPPDLITVTDSEQYPGQRLFYDEYNTDPLNSLPKTPGGKKGKRIMSVIIADCTEKLSGRDIVDVKAVGCFFGTQPVDGGGNAQVVWGEFIGKNNPACMGERLSLSPTTVTQKIILYKDAQSGDS